MTPNRAPTKTCPRCEATLHTARRGCECGYVFQQKTDPLEQLSQPSPLENKTIQRCLPDDYLYAGKVEIARKPLYVAYKKDESISLKADNLNTLVGLCWRLTVGKVPKAELHKHTL